MITLATYRESYLQEINRTLQNILSPVKVYVWKNNEGMIKGSVVVSREKIEMLFVHPDYLGQGIRSQLINFCVYTLGMDQVEQNESAFGIYDY